MTFNGTTLLLINANADVNVQDDEGNTALIYGKDSFINVLKSKFVFC